MNHSLFIWALWVICLRLIDPLGAAEQYKLNNNQHKHGLVAYLNPQPALGVCLTV